MATVRINIEGDNVADIMATLRAMGATGVSEDAPAAAAVRRGRPPKDKADGAATSDPLLPEGKTNAATNDPLASIDPDLAPPTTPKAMTFDDFLTEVRKLANGPNEAKVRARLRELGFEKVKDVPADKYTAVLPELQKAIQ